MTLTKKLYFKILRAQSNGSLTLLNIFLLSSKCLTVLLMASIIMIVFPNV